MDAYDAMMRKKRRKRLWLTVGLCVGIPVLLAAAALVFLFCVNQFRVDVTLHGDSEIVLEYGKAYEEPGADALFSGSILFRAGRNIPVKTEGAVDPLKVGTYTVQYTAGILSWSDSAVRTVQVVDHVAPQIILKGRPGTYVIPGQEYAEEGFVARDNYDGDISGRVQRTVKNGLIVYSVTDSSGNRAEATRKIVYYDPVLPELKLLGDAKITIYAGDSFTDPGCTASDNCDGDLTDRVTVTGQVNIYRAGTYTLTYTVEDSFGNVATAARTVTVASRPQPQTVMPNGKVIYLTFDDGPGPYTRQLLDVLKKYNVKATFFVIKSDYIDLVKDIVAEGHSVGIHSVSHQYQTIYASEEAYFCDLYEMQDIIEEKTGVKTTLVRFPGGSSNTVSRFNEGIMTRLTQALGDLGYQYFDWNVDSDDAGKTRQTDQVFQNVIAGVKKHDVSIVLQHDVKSYSVDAVEDIICWGLENGYTFLPLDATSPTAHHRVNN